jgi:PPM family protein phosphatase
MSIGEFARRSRLSPKALRLYDGLGLLSPARVDELSGYRYYEDGQLDQARLIATLRQVGVPLTTAKELLELEPAELAEQLTAFWRDAESRHAGQRELVTPEDLGVRITYLATPPITDASVPDCDFAVPFA